MPPVYGSHPEDLLRPASLDIFRRKEAREVMTDNLFASITFDSFGSSIPSNNCSLWVQHEDRVVLDFVEEHSIFFFAVPERLLRQVGGRDILHRDFRELVF